MKYAWRVVPLLLVIASMVAGYTAGAENTANTYRSRIGALNKQLDQVVEMQNYEKDAYEMSTASMQARIRQYMEMGCK